MINNFILALGIIVGLPVMSFFIIKFGTMGYYRAKQYMEKEDNNERNGHE
jgi:hypothetical protein